MRQCKVLPDCLIIIEELRVELKEQIKKTK